jgi:hypothetical protein
MLIFFGESELKDLARNIIICLYALHALHHMNIAVNLFLKVAVLRRSIQRTDQSIVIK